MAICDFLAGCPFYNDKMKIDSGIGGIYKKKYCEGDKTICARYKVATTVSKEAVPANLFPNMMERALEIINTQ